MGYRSVEGHSRDPEQKSCPTPSPQRITKAAHAVTAENRQALRGEFTGMIDVYRLENPFESRLLDPTHQQESVPVIRFLGLLH